MAALFGFGQVRGPLDRRFAWDVFVVGEDSGVVVGVVLPV
jgi:small basic protein